MAPKRSASSKYDTPVSVCGFFGTSDVAAMQESSSVVSCTGEDGTGADNVIMRLVVGKSADSSAPPTLEQPDPYNKHQHQLFLSPQGLSSSNVDVEPVLDHVEDACARSTAAAARLGRGTNVVRLLADFEEKSKNSEWPLTTSVHCYWCCHSFDSTPVGLPMRYKGGKFHVIGCFCSLECACAYNFNNSFGLSDSVDERLMRYALLNSLSVQLGGPQVICSAPTRLSLKMFGGNMTIQQFRDYSCGSNAKRKLIINSPPMHSTTQHMEEVHDRDMASDYKYIPIDNDRVTRYQERIRLTRTKPLINYKNTLDHSMNLKYHHRPASNSTASESFPALGQ